MLLKIKANQTFFLEMNQNTAIFASSSSVSSNKQIVSVEATINSDETGIKTVLAEFFSGAKLFAKIRRTEDGITKTTIQAHPKLLTSSLEYLKELLFIKYGAAIVWGKESIVVEENRLSSVTIEDTVPAGLKRDPSSGEFMEKHFEEISFGGSATTENLKKIAKDTFTRMTNAATGFGVAKGWIPVTKEKHISVKYKNQEFDLEISDILSMDALIRAVDDKFKAPVPIRLLYRLRDGNPIIVTDVKDMREGFLYYVLTANETLPHSSTSVSVSSFKSMEEFYAALEQKLTNPSKKERQMETIMKIFEEQDIEVGVLDRLTDEKLKEDGLKQGGLREAVLAVLGK